MHFFFGGGNFNIFFVILQPLNKISYIKYTFIKQFYFYVYETQTLHETDD